MKNLLIIGGSKFIGKSFVDYFNFQNKFKNLNITIISKKKISLPKKIIKLLLSTKILKV